MAEMYCTRCAYVGPTRRYMGGSFWTELFLWLVFLYPGFVYSSWLLAPCVIYSIWRLTTRHYGCTECGSTEVIPTTSPRARAALNIDEDQAAEAEALRAEMRAVRSQTVDTFGAVQ